MSEKFIFETAFTDEVSTEKAGLEVILREAKANDLNVKPLAWKIVTSSDGERRLQVLAEKHEGDFDKELPVEIEDVIEEPVVDSLEDAEEEGEDTDAKIDDLVDAVQELVEVLSEDSDSDDDEDDESFGDPDLDSVVDFESDDDDDKFFESKVKKAQLERIRRRAKKARQQRQAAVRAKRASAPKVERLETPIKQKGGVKVASAEARKSAAALTRKGQKMQGYKLARFGVDREKGIYVAEYVKP